MANDTTGTQRREGLMQRVADGWRRLVRAVSGNHPHTEGTHATTAMRPMSPPERLLGLPATEVFDGDDAVIVRIEAPGMDRHDFVVDLQGEHLRVRGEKRSQSTHKHGQYRVSECVYGSFDRLIPLPDVVDPERVKANYHQGVLEIELPKSEQEKRKPIRVDVR